MKEYRAKPVSGYYEVDDVTILRDAYLARENLTRNEDSGLISANSGEAYISNGYNNYMMPSLHEHVIDGGLEGIANCLTNGVTKKNILIPVLHGAHWVTYQILVDDNDTTLLIHDSANIHHDNSEFRIKIENLIKEQGKNFSYEKSKVNKIQIGSEGLRNVYCGGYTTRAMIGLLKNPEEENNIWFECDNLSDQNLRQRDAELVDIHAQAKASKFGVQNVDSSKQVALAKFRQQQEANNVLGTVLKDVALLNKDQRSQLQKIIDDALVNNGSADAILNSVRSSYKNFNSLNLGVNNPLRHFFQPNSLPESINEINGQENEGSINNYIPIHDPNSRVSILNLMREVIKYIIQLETKENKEEESGTELEKKESENTKVKNPFLEQLSRHYRGILTKLVEVSEGELKELIEKIVQSAQKPKKDPAIQKTEKDPDIQKTENTIQKIIEEKLRNHLKSQKREHRQRNYYYEEQSSYDESDEDAKEYDYPDDEISWNSENQESESSSNYSQDDASTSSSEESLSYSFRDLVNICSDNGKEPLSWLTNQYVEYHYEDIWDHVKEMILADKSLEVDKDLLKYIIDSASVFNKEDILAIEESTGKPIDLQNTETYHLFNSGSLGRDYSDEKLVSGGFIIDALSNYLQKINIERLKKVVEKEFSYAKEIQENGWLKEFEKEYNDAAKRNDLVKQNQLWAVFDLLQQDLLDKKSKEKPSDIIINKLEVAKKKYEERASEYYFRIYPQHTTDKMVYSSKKPEKVAAIEMDQVLGEIQDIGEKIKDVLLQKTKAKAKDTTNVVTPVLCFVVSNRPHKTNKEDRDHGRIIIPTSFDLDLEKYLLSKDQDDGVVLVDDKAFFGKTKSDSEMGMQKVKINAPDAKQDTNPKLENELLAHSERVMFEALRNRTNVKKLAQLLHGELKKIYKDELDDEDRFKVYSVALLAYSTNSVCQLCSPAIIAHENYSKDSFLNILTQELIKFEKEDGKTRLFKIRGENLISDELKGDEEIPEEIKKKFHLTTVIASKKPFTVQSEDMHEEGAKDYGNQKSKIYLENDAIDLHKHQKDEFDNEISGNLSFYEFSRSKFSENLFVEQPKDKAGIDFKFVGKSFMSGGKISKTSYKKRSELDEEVSKIIQAREVIKLCNVQNKGEFTNR